MNEGSEGEKRASIDERQTPDKQQQYEEMVIQTHALKYLHTKTFNEYSLLVHIFLRYSSPSLSLYSLSLHSHFSDAYYFIFFPRFGFYYYYQRVHVCVATLPSPFSGRPIPPVH